MPRLRVLKKPTKSRQNDSDSEWNTFEELIEQNDCLKDQVAQKNLEIRRLEAKIKQQTFEFDIIDWYTRVLEDGVNTKDLCIEMVKIKE